MAGVGTSGPAQADVDALRGLLDLMQNFPNNDQRARYLLASNWMRDRDRDRQLRCAHEWNEPNLIECGLCGATRCCDAPTFEEHLENHYNTDTIDGL